MRSQRLPLLAPATALGLTLTACGGGTEQPVVDAELEETRGTAVPLQLEQQGLRELTERYQQELKDQQQ